jgi:hypothetical protein
MKAARSWEPNLGHLGNQITVGNCELIKLNHGIKVIKRIEKKRRRKQRENNEMDGRERRKVKEKGEQKETSQSILAHILLFTLFDLVAFP